MTLSATSPAFLLLGSSLKMPGANCASRIAMGMNDTALGVAFVAKHYIGVVGYDLDDTTP